MGPTSRRSRMTRPVEASASILTCAVSTPSPRTRKRTALPNSSSPMRLIHPLACPSRLKPIATLLSAPAMWRRNMVASRSGPLCSASSRTIVSPSVTTSRLIPLENGSVLAMLSREENELIVRTGPRTPMGQVMRRYWMPILLGREVAEPDGEPVRVQVLGEKLVAFRDTDGRIGLLDEFCPHRCVSLWFGRNEACGLRCVYHGWKFDVSGAW